jgi:UDPglucose 6-dehydrogenase
MFMKICVLGLWHLGTVTAACLASRAHEVVGLDFDAETVSRLQSGIPPLFEPGLEELIKRGLAEKHLSFTMDISAALRFAEIVWVTYDTPVNEHDQADVDFVVERVKRLFPFLEAGTLVLISSQLPVGTTRRLEQAYAMAYPAGAKKVSFGYSPENLRLGKAISAFTMPDRIVVGIRSQDAHDRVTALLQPFTKRIEWMSVESAEMTKHALNAFLAASVAFANELAAICEQAGADAKEVERGLKTEARIGPNAYLSPGGAFAGGTLARDIAFLTQLGTDHNVPLRLIPAVRFSNNEHKNWPRRKLSEAMGTLAKRRIAVWGLTYKPGTNTLRRSSSVELCVWLVQQGAQVHAHDPVIKELPRELTGIMTLHSTPLDAVKDTSALVIATEWPEYQAVPAQDIVSAMSCPLVIDTNRFLAKTLGVNQSIRYLAVGMPLSFNAPEKKAAIKYNLTGRVAVITGANQGFGLAVARAFVNAGASVLMCARNASRLEEARREVAALAGPHQIVLAQPADVSREKDVEQLAGEALERFPQVHILVNNAGVYGPLGLIEEVDWAAWVHAVEVNLLGSVLMCRAFMPHFKSQKYGKILQLSGGGATNPLPRISAYAVSKAAIVRFAETLAEETREDHIDVNAIAPGALNTRMLDEILEAGPEKVGKAFFQRSLKQKESGGIPLERGAELALFLASAASDGITGKIISAVWDHWESFPEHVDDLRDTDIYTLRRIVPKDRGLSWGE